jgi:carboxymethylenebutenolidase
MQWLTAADFHPEVLRLFDRYVHGLMPRAEFIDAAGRFAGAGQTGLTLLEALSPKFEAATQVRPDDVRIQASYVEFDSPAGYGRMRGYLVTPAKPAGKLPGVLVCHENRGLNPHIEDIARRLAVEGFIAFAPDALTTLGGYPGDEDKAREMFATLERAKVQLDFLAAAQYFKALPDLNGRYGAAGFCFGGGVVNFLATRLADLGAAVPFYGGAAPTPDVAKIRSPLMLHFAEHDERINAQWPAYEAALKAAGIPYQAFVYPGTQHGFNNDTTPRYDAEAAKLAWGRTVAFFNTQLRTN